MRVDLAGKKFGRLTVTKKHDVVGKGETRWLCSCDCGNESIVVSRGNLKSGHTQSCGCLQKENTSKACKKYNKYDLSGEYGIGYTTNTNSIFCFDLEDYDKIKDFCWYENDQGYILTTKKGVNKNIRMHRLIMDVLNKKEIEIDHKNLKRNDNRKTNLRFANKQLNGANRDKNKNNKLGIKGVHKKNGKYYPKVTKDGKTIYLGTYTDLEEAIKVHNKKQIECFGEFAFKNSNQTL